jgi:hypothetical protein
MPKVTPPSSILAGNLLKGRVIFTPPQPAPVDTVVVTPPRGPVQNGPIANPSTPPAGLSGMSLARWVSERLLEQESLRAGSFWDTGHLLGLMMPGKDLLGFKDLKTVVEQYQLPISHFTAQKFLMVARSFDRETAKNTGIEKCYALTLYAKATGRAGRAAEILAKNERISGTELPPARSLAKSISASQLMAVVRRLKTEARGEKVPTAVQQEREKLGKDTRKIIRDLGFKRASASIVRRDGRPMIAIYLSLEDAQRWDLSKAIPMIAKVMKEDRAALQLLQSKVPALTLKRSA